MKLNVIAKFRVRGQGCFLHHWDVGDFDIDITSVKKGDNDGFYITDIVNEIEKKLPVDNDWEIKPFLIRKGQGTADYVKPNLIG